MVGRGDLTSFVFHRCLSFGNEGHFGRHSSSFLGRYIFKCPCSSEDTEKSTESVSASLEHIHFYALANKGGHWQCKPK